MSLEKLSITTLAALDGERLKHTFDQALNRLRLDCEERAADSKPRKLVLEVCLEPSVDEDDAGLLDTVNIEWRVKKSIPQRRSKVYSALAADGGLYLNDLSPRDARQKTIDDVPQPKGTQNVDADDDSNTTRAEKEA